MDDAASFWAAQGGRRSPMPPDDDWLIANVVDGWDIDVDLGGAGQWSYVVSRIDVVEAGMRVVVRERFTGTLDEFVELDEKRFLIVNFRDRASPPDEVWRFGVEYADGLRISTVDGLWLRRNGFSARPDVVVSELWSTGRFDDNPMPFWFSPPPPPGPLTFAVEWPLVGLPFRSATIDTRELDQKAKTRAVWPPLGLLFVRQPPPDG
jgi:hypothetical protein